MGTGRQRSEAGIQILPAHPGGKEAASRGGVEMEADDGRHRADHVARQGKLTMRWRRRKESEHDLERELRSHLELEAEERQEDGLPPDQATYAARRAFGNTTSVQEEIRDMSGWLLL